MTSRNLGRPLIFHVLMTKPTSVGAAVSLLERFSASQSWYSVLSFQRVGHRRSASPAIPRRSLWFQHCCRFNCFFSSWTHSYSMGRCSLCCSPWALKATLIRCVAFCSSGHSHLLGIGALPKSSTSSPKSSTFFTRGQALSLPLQAHPSVPRAPVPHLSLPPRTHDAKTAWQLYRRDCSKDKKKAFFPFLSHSTRGSRSNAAVSWALTKHAFYFFLTALLISKI